jgi:hypothetical protein
MADRLTNLHIDRVAFVAAGDNPDAEIVLWKMDKREVGTSERDRLASRGAAMPDGGYPIANVSDLKNAIQAIGRAKNPAAVKRHIVKRARALGRTDLIPKGWTSKEGTVGDVVKEPRMTGSRVARLRAAWGQIGDLLGEVGGGKEGTVPEEAESTKTLPEDASDEVREMFEVLQKERDDALAKAEEAAKAAAEPEPDPDPDEALTKALARDDLDDDVKAALTLAKEAREIADAATAEVEKMRGEEAEREARETIKGWRNLPVGDDFAPKLASLRKADPELAEAIEKQMARTDAMASETLKVIGADGTGETDAQAAIDAIAAELRKADPAITKEKAVALAAKTPEGRELHRQHTEQVKEGDR